MFAVLAVLIMTVVAFVPALEQVESASSEDYWTYSITSSDKGVEVKSSGSKVPGFVAPKTDTGKYDCNTPGYDAGVWGFDSDGYGPFGSFYAAFDACHGNKIVCHLDPNNLRSSLDGNIEIDDESKYMDSKGVKHIVNIMWVLPTIYWSVDSSGSLVLSNDPSKGTAYAHTFDGKEEPYKYLGIGVYEASIKTVNGEDTLTSATNSYPESNHTRSVFRDYANKNKVATEDGMNDNGHAMLWNLYAWQLYRFCVLTVGSGWDSQGIFGNGDCTGGHFGTSVNTTGDLDESGPYAGKVGYSDGWLTIYHNDSVKAFIEDAWGSLYEFVDGVLICYGSQSRYEIQMYATQSSKPSDSADDYKTMIGVLPMSGYNGPSTSSSYPAYWGLPTNTEGSVRSGLYDYLYSWSPGYSWPSSCGLYVGGYSGRSGDNAPKCGLSCMIAGVDVGASNQATGGRLAFAFDDDPVAPTPKVTYNHDDLRALLKEFGYSERYIEELPTEKTIAEGGMYDQLKDIAGENGFRHVGWIVDGEQYSATHEFVKMTTHTAKSVWVGLPAVTYNHAELVRLTNDPDSEAGLSHGLEIRGHDRYEQLPPRNGYAHVGWQIDLGEKVYKIGPTDPFVTKNSHTAVSLWTSVPMVSFDHSNLTSIVGTAAEGVSDLEKGMLIEGHSKYPQLPDTAGYRHIGWRIGFDEKVYEVGPTGGFATRNSHTAVSLWEEIPMVTFDHGYLMGIVGTNAKGVSDLEKGMLIEGHSNYPQLPDTAGYRHIGWEIDGKTVRPTASLVSEKTHDAKSLWKKISVVPIFPDDEEEAIEVVIQGDSEPWLGKNGKTVLLVAIIIAIIAELAVLCISRKR